MTRPAKSSPCANKFLRANPKLQLAWWTQVAVTAALAVACAVLIRAVPFGVSVFLGVGLLWAFWLRRAKVVRIMPHHIELKAAPLGGVRRIAFRDLRRIEVARKGKALHIHHDQDGVPRTCKFALVLIAKDLRPQFVRFLTAKAQSRSPAAEPRRRVATRRAVTA